MTGIVTEDHHGYISLACGLDSLIEHRGVIGGEAATFGVDNLGRGRDGSLDTVEYRFKLTVERLARVVAEL